MGADHFPQASSAILAGAGIRGGTVHGATDATGSKVVDGKIGVPDLMATIVSLAGLDPNENHSTPAGRPDQRLTDGGKPVRDVMA